jgi:predicted enzyme involved in methoxymalonyl-ACP biosynthesis
MKKLRQPGAVLAALSKHDETTAIEIFKKKVDRFS